MVFPARAWTSCSLISSYRSFQARMRSQNAGLGLKGSSYGASSSDSYKDKLKKLVCINSVLIHNFYVGSSKL